MILEGMSLKKIVILLIQETMQVLFIRITILTNLILNSYNDFSEKILASLKSQKFNTLNYDRMCLDSSITSERIYTNIKKLKIEK